ncbi:MAG: pentapeptide repeat-containing protein [Coleofasciculus sp. G3-WIS-01]|uniref:pentapeptide repeat-containing protein n=1 Tax=Coleofasciculus sp. G3-WIS-01 TaxID=3069528 RepID=UPI0033005D55
MQSSDRNILNQHQSSASARKQELFKKLERIRVVPSRLLEEYGAGERDYRGFNLSNLELNGVDLQRIDLSQANLEGIILEKANLTRANFSRANLCRANLRRADLIWANLHCANLQGANLRGADLSGADLSGADLTDADLGGAILPDGTIVLTSEQSSLLCSRLKKLPQGKPRRIQVDI